MILKYLKLHMKNKLTLVPVLIITIHSLFVLPLNVKQNDFTPIYYSFFNIYQTCFLLYPLFNVFILFNHFVFDKEIVCCRMASFKKYWLIRFCSLFFDSVFYTCFLQIVFSGFLLRHNINLFTMSFFPFFVQSFLLQLLSLFVYSLVFGISCFLLTSISLGILCSFSTIIIELSVLLWGGGTPFFILKAFCYPSNNIMSSLYSMIVLSGVILGFYLLLGIWSSQYNFWGKETD